MHVNATELLLSRNKHTVLISVHDCLNPSQFQGSGFLQKPHACPSFADQQIPRLYDSWDPA